MSELLFDFLNFLSLRDPNVRNVVIGTVLVGVSSALVGSFALLRKRALIGDAIAHSVLPGIGLGFLLAGSKSLPWLLGGAFVTAWLSIYAVDGLTRRTKLTSDAAIAIVLSVFFGAGAFLLKVIQNSGHQDQSGLESFLLGSAAALMGRDLYVFGGVAVVLIAAVLFFYKEFKLIAFDQAFAKAAGIPTRRIELLLTTLTVLAVVVGIQAVGVVLMSAMLITPAAAAYYFTRRLSVMLALAAVFASFASVSGAFISFQYPRMPTGPWIVVVASLIAFGAFLLSPRRGVLSWTLARWRHRMRILEENVLKCFYQMGERDGDFKAPRRMAHLRSLRPIKNWKLLPMLVHLQRKGLIWRGADGYRLTDAGIEAGKRISRLHRLWEQYLTQEVGIAPDHVHEDAETMEHIITPELEKKLVQQLDFPEQDPHHTQIPY